MSWLHRLLGLLSHGMQFTDCTPPPCAALGFAQRLYGAPAASPPTSRSPQEPGCPTALQLSPSSSSQPATARPATQPLTTAALFVQHGFSRFPSALSLSNCRFGYPAAGGQHLWVCIPLRPKVLNRRPNVLVVGQGRGYVV